VKDLYNENYGSLKEEIEVQIRRLKDLLCSWISRLNIVKMALLSKVIYKLNAPNQNFNDSLQRKENQS
jgi:hypothetical protein